MLRRFQPCAARLITAAFVAAVLLSTGCSSINPKRMAPQPPSPPLARIGGTIGVVEVTGGRKTTFGGADMVNDDQFRKALVLALQRSGLFDSVSTDHGDFDLHANIRSEDQRVERGLQYTATMIVSYRVLDRSGRPVWAASYDSQASSTAFSGATRTVQAREGAVRESLTSLIQGLSQQLPKK